LAFSVKMFTKRPEGGANPVDFRLTPQQAEFVEALRTHLDTLDVDDVIDEIKAAGGAEMDAGTEGLRFLRSLGQAGWLGVGWPEEYGGQGRSELEQWHFIEELAHRRLPNGGLTISSVGPTIARVCSDEQKSRYLPGILSGDVVFAVGYTEPNAGSDLAAMETRARRDADTYVVTGQKIFTSLAHSASHVFLAARTGTREEKHRGITTMIVPLDTPGISVRPLYTQGGIRTNEVFFEDVRVPVVNRVGDENDGWRIIVMALDFERLFAHSGLVHDFEDLVEWAAAAAPPPFSSGSSVAADPVSRQTLAELAVGIDITRLFLLRTAWMMDEDQVPNAEASMSKISLAENIQLVTSGALQLMGEEGQLRHGAAEAPADGYLERRYRTSTMLKFGGGTNEVQRNIIAQRGLGLPR